MPNKSVAVTLIGMLAGARNEFPSSGLVRLTKGGSLLTTVMFTGVEVAVAPSLSVAVALSVKAPTGGLLQTKLYGAVVSSPSLVAPWKNSTLAIVLSLSAAAAVSVTFDNSLKTWPGVGLVKLTVGGSFTGKPTPLAIWMVNRSLNGTRSREQRQFYMDLLRFAVDHPAAPESAKREAQHFIEYQTKAV